MKCQLTLILGASSVSKLADFSPPHLLYFFPLCTSKSSFIKSNEQLSVVLIQQTCTPRPAEGADSTF